MNFSVSIRLGGLVLHSVLYSLILVIVLLSGCSSGNNSSNSNQDITALQIIAPRVIYSKSMQVGSAYIVINNPTATAVKNVLYSLTNPIGSGNSVRVDSVSSAACAIVAANSQCYVKILVESGAVAGSVGFNISNKNDSLFGKSSQSVKAVSPSATIGVEQVAYNNLSGADGITLSYYHTVINGTPYILVSGAVASANAGTFNKIVLVNGSGAVLPNQELISLVSNTQGSTFNILLAVPAGNNISQTIKVQTRQNDKVVSTAVSGSILTTTENVGIAEMLPSAVYLSATDPKQIVTFLNIGDTRAQLQKLTTNNPNVEVIFNLSDLSSAATTTATLKLKSRVVAASSGDVILTYNNGQSEISTSGTVEQNINPTPSPSPTPTPLSPPMSGLTAIFSPDNDFFKTSAGAVVTRQLSLTNTGNTDENAIVLTLPSNFTISAGSIPETSCIVTQVNSPSTLSNTLSAGSECTITVTYSNDMVTPQAFDNISIAYNYNNGIPAPTPTMAAVNYEVVQSTAVLSLSPNTAQNYGSIPSNNTAISNPITYTLTNSGEVTATSLAFTFDGTNASLFSVVLGGTCAVSGSLPSALGSNTCTIDTEFGPAPNGSVGSRNANFRIDYIPYLSGTIEGTSVVNVSGTVTAAPSATFTSTVTGNTFTEGNGTSGTPYTGYTSTGYTIDVTYTNTSSIPASGFTTAYTTPPTGWTMSTHGCNNLPMVATDGTCTDVYTLNSASTGMTSINLGNVTASWSDSSGTYSNQAIQGATVYADLSVLPVPTAITITPITNWQTVMGSAYAFTATITGGSSTITPTVTGLTGSTASPVSCDLDSSAPATSSCTFIITPYTGTGNYSFWNPATISNSTDVNNPTLITSQSIGLNVLATNNATINGNASPQTFSNIAGTVIAPYVYLAAPEEGTSSATNVGITWGSGGTVSPRFEAGSQSGGGTCTDSLKDNLTGLEWAKNGIIGFEATEGGGPIAQPDYSNTIANLNNLIWSQAVAAINNMNTATMKLCGYSDWRLPTIKELLSLVNYTASQNYVQQSHWLNSNGFSNVQADYYWSSTVYAVSGIWFIIFSSGQTGSRMMTNSSYVWPVRGG